jgi:quercetin dioxygenase-like cupin family protein
MLKKALAVAVLIAPIAIVSAVAQQAGIKRTPLQTVDFPPGYQTISVIAEIGAGSCAGRHTHPGTESTYVLEGEGVLKVDGKPDTPMKAGVSFQLPVGVVHDACAAAGAPLKVLAIYSVEKGKPAASPAP